MGTGDWRALHRAWEGETQVTPCVTLESRVARAREALRDEVEMVERLRFSAWVNVLRAALEAKEEAAHEAWADLLREGR